MDIVSYLYRYDCDTDNDGIWEHWYGTREKMTEML